MSDEPSHWHGYRSGVDWLKANVALLPLITLAGYAALALADQRYDARYVQSVALSDAVQQIQLGQIDERLLTLDTQIQIAYRRLATVNADSPSAAEIRDEIRVLEDARKAAERARETILKRHR